MEGHGPRLCPGMRRRRVNAGSEEQLGGGKYTQEPSSQGRVGGSKESRERFRKTEIWLGKKTEMQGAK